MDKHFIMEADASKLITVYPPQYLKFISFV